MRKDRVRKTEIKSGNVKVLLREKQTDAERNKGYSNVNWRQG